MHKFEIYFVAVLVTWVVWLVVGWFISEPESRAALTSVVMFAMIFWRR